MPDPPVVALAVAYIVLVLALNPVLARAWLAGRISRRGLAVARAARWASIGVALLVAGQLLTPLGGVLVLGMFGWSLFLHLRMLPQAPPDPVENATAAHVTFPHAD